MFHGTADKHVPYEFMTKATEMFKEKGVSAWLKFCYEYYYCIDEECGVEYVSCCQASHYSKNDRLDKRFPGGEVGEVMLWNVVLDGCLLFVFYKSNHFNDIHRFLSMFSHLARVGKYAKFGNYLCKRQFATGVAFANRLACWNTLFPASSSSEHDKVLLYLVTVW